MVEIKPLKGFMYNKEIIKDFSKVITPPNDVISKEKKEELKARSPYNFVNLILPDENGNKYENAAKLFKKWQDEGILVEDDKEAIYVYSENYSVNGNNFERLGFICLIKLEGWGKGVLPHEKILEKDLQDRFSLIYATRANLEIPFLLYDDRKRIIDGIIKNEIGRRNPYIDFVDDEGVNHKVWRIPNKEFIGKIKKEMEKYQCIIADGHHRYISAVKFRDLSKLKEAKYSLMCLINSFNEGMIILPTNRIVFGLENVDMGSFLSKLEGYFEVEEVLDIEELVGKVEGTKVMIDKTINLKNHVFGIYSKINEKCYFLRLKNNDVLDKVLPNNTDVYKKLDMNILHKIIIEKILGITEKQQKNREHIDFIKGTEETIQRIRDEDMQFAFFVNPPLMREIFLTSRAGEVMPQKSTYFYPKVFSGLVIYKMEGI